MLRTIIAKGLRPIHPIALFILPVLALFGVSLIYLSGSFEVLFFNADALYLPVLFTDLLGDHGKLADWYLTPAPYFFPDYITYFIAYLIGWNIFTQILAFILVQFSLLFVSVWLLQSQVLKQYQLVTTVVVTMLLLCFAVELIDGYRYLFVGAYHYGAFIAQLIFVALWLRYSQSNVLSKNRMLILMMSVISFFVALSDNIFIAQTLIPFIATALLFAILSQQVSINKTCVGLIPFSFGWLGSLAYRWVVYHPTRYQTSIDISMFGSNFDNIVYFFDQLLVRSALLDVFFTGYLVLIFTVIYRMIRHKVNITAEYPLIWLTLFSVIGLITSLLMFSFVNTPLRGRYMIPALSWPLILLPIAAASYLKHYFHYIGSALSLMIVTLILVYALYLGINNGIELEHYPQGLACIDDVLRKEQIRNGIAQYWDAKYIKAFSRLKINIAQHFDNLDQHRWITSGRYFKERYDFAIIDDAAPDPYYIISSFALVGVNGQPAKIVKCANKTLYIYGQNKMRVKE